MFLASWSLDPRAITDEAAAAGRSTADRIKDLQFTRGQPRVSGTCAQSRKREKMWCLRHESGFQMGDNTRPSAFRAWEKDERGSWPCLRSTTSQIRSPFRQLLAVNPYRCILSSRQYGAIDVGHVAATDIGSGQPDHACVLALVRALQYNTFFAHLDLSTANTSAAGCWSEDPFGPSDVASGPLATAVQVKNGWRTIPGTVTLRHLFKVQHRGKFRYQTAVLSMKTPSGGGFKS